MRFSTINEWLEWQQTLHWQEIELGLERIQQVASNLQINKIAKQTIIVAGTNGKGSTVAYYSAFLQAAGFSVGCYTSPHLQDYNERIQINGEVESDEQIMQAFEQIDQARGELSLSYFEFGTLAALLCIKQAHVDVAILEVGLGGRLDAVNIIDADLVHFTPIGIDHTAWLGDTKEKIAVEKAGVLRQDCLVICNDEQPPKSLTNEIRSFAKKSLSIGKEYYFDQKNCDYVDPELKIDLSSLVLKGHHQYLNCCGVIAGLRLLNDGYFFNPDKIKQSLNTVQIKGRFETVHQDNDCKTIIDVGHNSDAAKVLAQQLLIEQARKCVLILGMLDDKDVNVFTDKLSNVVDHCICIDLQGDRALSADELSAKIRSSKMTKEKSSNMMQALNKAKDYLTKDSPSKTSRQDIILITGSFYTVEAYLALSSTLL